MSMTITEIESIASLDFEFSPPCEALTWPGFENTVCGGNNAAEWRVTIACTCSRGQIRLYCTGCIKHKLSRKYIMCFTCGDNFSPGYTAYLSVTKL